MQEDKRTRSESSIAERSDEEAAASPGDLLQPRTGARPAPRTTALDEREALVGRLTGLDPAEILPRISQGDPLGVQMTCMRRLREQGLILDPERAFERCLVEVAVELELATPGTRGGDWLQVSVDRALARLVAEDFRAENEASPSPLEDSAPYRFVHDAFATPLDLCRKATTEFHLLPLRARLGFFYLLVDNMEVADVLATGLWQDPEELRMDVWEALRALTHVSPEEVKTFRNRKRRT